MPIRSINSSYYSYNTKSQRIPRNLHCKDNGGHSQANSHNTSVEHLGSVLARPGGTNAAAATVAASTTAAASTAATVTAPCVGITTSTAAIAACGRDRFDCL